MPIPTPNTNYLPYLDEQGKRNWIWIYGLMGWREVVPFNGLPQLLQFFSVGGEINPIYSQNMLFDDLYTVLYPFFPTHDLVIGLDPATGLRTLLQAEGVGFTPYNNVIRVYENTPGQTTFISVGGTKITMAITPEYYNSVVSSGNQIF